MMSGINRGINVLQTRFFIGFRKAAMMIKALPFFVMIEDITFAIMLLIDDLRQAIGDRNWIEQNAMRINCHREFCPR